MKAALSGCRCPLRSAGTVSGCCCLFKEAGLYPEEAEKFRLPDLRFPATRRDRNLRGASEARSFPGPAGRRAPRGEAAGCAGLARDKGGPLSPACPGRCGPAPPPKTLLLLFGQLFARPAWAQGARGVRVAITPAPADLLSCALSALLSHLMAPNTV